MTASALPAQFAALEPFVAHWAQPTEDARSQRRWTATPAEFQAFYDAALPHIEAILALLDQYPFGAVPPELRPLYHLALAFAEASPHVELYKGDSQVPYSFDPSRFVATHGAQPD